ncbi:MAG: hypothetical protein JRF54_03025, partial [Deltaproteobacteria bacterium]|nr:hypothetical protein [Deltaproteobacteria bacterium]
RAFSERHPRREQPTEDQGRRGNQAPEECARHTGDDACASAELQEETTAGGNKVHGDVTLGTEWRLLAAFEAANGINMFGWTTALVVAYVQRLAAPQADHTAS